MTSDDWLERVWEYREEQIYPKLFGSIGNRIFPLSGNLFTSTFGQDSVDPRWLFYGVFESPPCKEHPSWLYVTSGMSNPWEDERPSPEGPSGLGCEFVFETSEQDEWPIHRVQHLMAFQILLANDRYPDHGMLDVYDRVPLGGSITPEPSELTRIMVAPPLGYDPSFQLESGQVDLLALVGITEAETRFARENGGRSLVEHLVQHEAFPVTDPQRPCTLSG